MRSIWQKRAAEVSAPFLAALLLGAAYLGFVTWDQAHWWYTKEEYSFGWLVPAFVAFVVHDRWPRIVAAAAACAAEGSLRAAGWQKWVLRLMVGASIAMGGAMFVVGALYRAGAGPSQPGTLAISLGAAGILLPLLLLNSPAPVVSVPGGLWSDARLRLVQWFVFPVLVWLVSAPMVSAVESRLSLVLLHQVVNVVSFGFNLLGLPIEQQGNVLVLPTGNVGVEDACSGIRSLTACLFAGSFLSAVFLEKLWKKVALVVAAMGFAFFTNLIRSLFLTGWAYRYGPHAIEGTVHDAAGYSVLGLTVIGLLCLLPLLNLRFSAGSGTGDATTAQ
jgi:exosortase